MKKNLTSLKNVLLVTAFAVFLIFFFINISWFWGVLKTIINILTPFLIGFLIAYILNFPYKFFCTKVFGKMGTKHKSLEKLRKPISLIITYTLMIAIFVALIMILIPQIINSLSKLANDSPKYIKSVEATVQEYSAKLSEMNIPFLQNINQDDVISGVSNFLTGSQDVTNGVLNWLKGFIADFAMGVYNFLMGFMISIYFLIFKEQLCRQIKKLAVAFVPIKYLPKLYEIVDITDTKCGRFLVGDIIDAAVIGVLFFITLSIFQFPYAALIAVICGVTNIIPFFGPFIGAIPSGFILLLIDPWLALWFIVIMIVLQQIDGNILKPNIIGNQLGISSFWVLFSVIVGGALFGMLGCVLGAPIYAVIYTLVAKRARNKIEEKGKVAQEALDFHVLNYTQIAEEQRKIRAEKEQEQRKKLHKLLHLGKKDEDGGAETGAAAEASDKTAEETGKNDESFTDNIRNNVK